MIIAEYKLYFFLAFILVGSWFVADFYDKEEQETVKLVAHSPDYFSYGYYKKEMTELGMVKNELTADKMTHYSDDQKTHLDNPVMTLYNSKKPPWIIKSERGILEEDGDHLLLSGKVLIRRDGIKKRKPFVINTSELKVVLSTSYAETGQWAEIIDGANRTEGVGMETVFIDPIKLKFLSRVKGRYEFN